MLYPDLKTWSIPMPVKKSKLKVPTAHGPYEAEGPFQIAAVVLIELFRNHPAFVAAAILLAGFLGEKEEVLALVSSTSRW